MQYQTQLLSSSFLNDEQLRTIIPFSTLQSNPDIIWVRKDEDLSIGIERIHTLISALCYKPYQEKYKVALIEEAHLLTPPAQQALLKTLEEPPDDTQVILLTSYPSALLPTILSRCAVRSMNTQSTHIDENDSDIQTLYHQSSSSSIATCINNAQLISTSRDNARKTMLHILELLHQDVLNGVEQGTQALQKEISLINALEGLEKNGNVKLVIENALFSLRSSSQPLI